MKSGHLMYKPQGTETIENCSVWAKSGKVLSATTTSLHTAAHKQATDAPAGKLGDDQLVVLCPISLRPPLLVWWRAQQLLSNTGHYPNKELKLIVMTIISHIEIAHTSIHCSLIFITVMTTSPFSNFRRIESGLHHLENSNFWTGITWTGIYSTLSCSTVLSFPCILQENFNPHIK